MSDFSEIAIVILNWNGENFLKKFLPSVIENSENAHIYVADNASTDNSIELLQKDFQGIKIIRNLENEGFAKGYNDALKQISEPYYLLLNSDVQVTKNWLRPLYDALQSQNVAAVQPKIKSFQYQDKFEHAGASGGFMDIDFYPFCRGRIFDFVETDTKQYDYPMEVFWTSGACMLIKRSIFWEVDGFDEDFFAHMEEIDMCWRIKKKNYSLQIIPESQVFHVGGGTLNYQSPRKTYLNYRNNLYMIVKNYHSNWMFIKLFKRMVLDGISGVVFLLKGQPKHTAAILKAHLSLYRNFKKVLSKRSKEDSKSYKSIDGVYHGSILWAYFILKIQKFSLLNLRKMNKSN